MSTVDVSVLITCFNKEKFLDECVSSVLRQTKLPKEIILVHDGCSEPISHAQCHTIILKENVGVAKARHEAFRFSTGKLVLFVDGDDCLSPDYLEKMILVLAKKGADVVYPDLFVWGKTLSLITPPKTMPSKYVKRLEKIPVPVTCLIRRELYENVGGFRELPVLEDMDFWARAMRKGYVFKKAETLLWYRRYEGTRNTADIVKKKEVLKEIMQQVPDEEVRV